ncbi:MAG: AAA family ATPase [Bacteroidota bacterium]
MDELKQRMMDDILGEAGVQLTQDQEMALQVFMNFFRSDEPRCTYLLTGSAGTGKTFMINFFRKLLRKHGFKVILLAPTGRAAKVITRRSKSLAFTIHHHIYQVSEDGFGEVRFRSRNNKEGPRTVYIVDEASMIGDQHDETTRQGLLHDLLDYVFESNPDRKLVLVGDPVQLPPVGHNDSPALSGEYLEDILRLSLYAAHLSEVKRQEAASGVLENAIRIRDSYLSTDQVHPELTTNREVHWLDNGYEGMETYIGYYDPGNLDKCVFITYSNYRAVQVNQAIRQQLYWNEARLLEPGDMLMVVRNNYAYSSERMPFLANGEMGTVIDIDWDSQEERYGLHWINAELEFADSQQEAFQVSCKLVTDLLESKAPQLTNQEMRKVMWARQQEYMDLPKKEANSLMRKDPYIQALQVKFGYAITGHKSQGGQWENVVVGFEPNYSNDLKAYIRWTYTVFTRAEERVFVLDCPFLTQ